jgi:hypothetical protein
MSRLDRYVGWIGYHIGWRLAGQAEGQESCLFVAFTSSGNSVSNLWI